MEDAPAVVAALLEPFDEAGLSKKWVGRRLCLAVAIQGLVSFVDFKENSKPKCIYTAGHAFWPTT